MGVVPYLTTEAVVTTLRTIATCAPGSAVVLSYLAEDSVFDDNSRTLVEIISALAAGMGEPVQDGLSVAAMERLSRTAGFGRGSPHRDDLVQRYVADRTRRIMPWNERPISGPVP